MTTLVKKARGFTLVELAIVLTIGAVFIPTAYVVQRQLETAQSRSVARLEAARAARGVSEEIRKDLRTRHFDRGMQLAGADDDPCSIVAYVVDDGEALTRKVDAACGPSRVLARGVAGLARDGNVVTLALAHRMRDGSTVKDAFVFGFVGGAE